MNTCASLWKNLYSIKFLKCFFLSWEKESDEIYQLTAFMIDFTEQLLDIQYFSVQLFIVYAQYISILLILFFDLISNWYSCFLTICYQIKNVSAAYCWYTCCYIILKIVAKQGMIFIQLYFIRTPIVKCIKITLISKVDYKFQLEYNEQIVYT